MKKMLIVLISLSLLSLLIASFYAEPTALGAEKCAKMCHKIQYESWLKTKHAEQNPKVECETCHGKGSDYAKMSVMKNPDAAKAAGLIAKPQKSFCTEKCHKANFKDEMLKNTHEHKAK